MIVRRELPADVDAVQALQRRAFGQDLEADLLTALRADTGWMPALSLVAVEGETLLGHVVCTRGDVGGAPVVGLGPIGVEPERQHGRVGTALMHAVLGAAEALGEPLVCLLGDPDFYGRFGFVAASDVGVESPDPSWGGFFQARALAPDHPRGAFAYAAPFRDL